MNRRSAAVLVGLLLAAPALLAAYRHGRTEEAWDLLRAAATAHERVSYQGSAAWTCDRCRGKVSVRHDARSGRTRYRWSRGPAITLAAPSARLPDPAGWCLDLQALEESYRPELGEPTVWNDRPARVLKLEPRHEGRPSARLTLDAESLLPLEVAVFAADGSHYRTAGFLEVSPFQGEVEEPKRRPPAWFGRPVPPDELSAEVGFPVLRPAYLPPGFRLREARVVRRFGPAATLSYTDGLTVFELTQEKILLPVQLRAALPARLSAERKEAWVARYMQRRWKDLTEAGDADDGGVLVRRKRWGNHDFYRLNVSGLDVDLVARSDLAPSEIAKVLRSLTQS